MSRATTFLLASRQGRGKSSLLAQFPTPFFVCDPSEDGILDLIEERLVPKSVTRDYVWCMPDSDDGHTELISYLRNSIIGSSVKTLVLETVLGFQKLFYKEACHTEFNDNWTQGKGGFFGEFYKGPRVVAEKWVPEFIQCLREVRDSGIHVAITAHIKVKEKDNVDAADFASELIDADARFIQPFLTWVTTILSIRDISNIVTVEGQSAKRDGFTRYLCAEADPALDTKCKWAGMEDFPVGDSAAETYAALCKKIGRNPKTFMKV